MTKQNLNFPANKEICNATGCTKEATEQLEISAGRYGTISLLLCRPCVDKFRD